MTGQLVNTGRDLRFQVMGSGDGVSDRDQSNNSNTSNSPTITGGPLSYTYTLHSLVLHFGRTDSLGSEHTINGSHLPAELQLYCFNSDLFRSWEEAVAQANGVAAVAVLLQVNARHASNAQLRHLLTHTDSVRGKGGRSKVLKLSLAQLLPDTAQYVTYSGSLTQPSCQETVQWLLLNRPVYVSSEQLSLLRTSVALEGQSDANSRPTKPLHARPLITNIRPASLAQRRAKVGVCSPVSDLMSVPRPSLQAPPESVGTSRQSTGKDADKHRMAFCSSNGFLAYQGTPCAACLSVHRMQLLFVCLLSCCSCSHRDCILRLRLQVNVLSHVIHSASEISPDSACVQSELFN